MPIKPRCCNPFCCFSAVKKRPDPTSAGAQTAPSESGPGVSHDVADVSGVPGCDKAPPSGSSNVSRRCNPFCCFSAVEKRPDPTSAGAQTAPSESESGVSHDVADVSGVPGCDKAPPSGSSNVSLKSEGENVDARLNVEKRPTTSAGAAPSESGPEASHDVTDVPGVPGCYKAPPSGSSNVSLKSEGEDVDARLNVEKRPVTTSAGAAPSESGPFSQSPQGASHDVPDVSGVPGCDKAPPSGSSNVSLKSEAEDVDARLNVEKRPVTTPAGAAPSESGPFSQAPPGASHAEASTSGSDPISSIRKDIVGVEDVNLDDLMNHIYKLLKLREEGNQQQASNLRKFPWPKVPGLQKLKKIVSFGPDLQKLQNILSAAVTFGTELGVSISENNKENVMNNVLSALDRLLTNGRGEPVHLSDLPPNTSTLLILDVYDDAPFKYPFGDPDKDRFLWPLIEETVDDGMQIKIIYIGPHFDQLPTNVKDTIFVVHLSENSVDNIFRDMMLTAEGDVKGDVKGDGHYLQMDAKMVGEGNSDNCFCWRFLTEGELEEFVVCNSGRYLRLKQLQAETDEESSNIEMLRELFAPDGDETTPVFQKNESSGQVTTCGVDQFKGKTILLDLRSCNCPDDIGLPSLKEMYDVVVKQKLDLEIISIPILRQKDARIPTFPIYRKYRRQRHILELQNHFLRKVPWFVFLSRTTAVRTVDRFFLTEQCGWEEGDECEKWYASINCIIEPNGRVIPCRPFTKYTEAKSTPTLEFLFDQLEKTSDQVKRIMFQVKWGVKACPTVPEEIENFKKEEWEQLKSMSALEFLFNHLESTSDQVKKLMCQGKIICLRSGYQDDGCAQLMNEMDQFEKGIHVITMGDTRMERLLLTDTIYKNCHKLYRIPPYMEEMSSLNLSSHEHMIFSSRLHYLKEEINRIEESDKKLSGLKSVLHSFQDESSMTFMDQYGKLVATLGANNSKLIFPQRNKHRAQLFITSMMKDIEGGGKEMHDKDPGVSDSLIQNIPTASTSVAVEQQNMDAYFERLLEYISELWGMKLYQLFKFNKDGKKSSPSTVTWPALRGFCMLENFLSEGTHANWVKDVISRYPEEGMCETVIKCLLKDIEEENWGVAGLIGIAHVLERFDSVSANQIEQCLLVLGEMLRMAQYIKQLNEKPELSWRRGKRVATGLMVICSIACSSLIDPSKFALLELPTVDNGLLRRIQYELESTGGNIANVLTEGLGRESECTFEDTCDKFELFIQTSW